MNTDARVVSCSGPDCREAATYKIAAIWGDGRFRELKTYGLACANHVGEVFRGAEQRRRAFRPMEGETIQEIGIYRCEPGRPDRHLERDQALEKTHRA